MAYLTRNIGVTGRVLRGIVSLILGIGAVALWRRSHPAGAALASASAFVAFEAARGWCVARACGIKTKY